MAVKKELPEEVLAALIAVSVASISLNSVTSCSCYFVLPVAAIVTVIKIKHMLIAIMIKKQQ